MCGRKNKKANSCCKQENNGKHKISCYQCIKNRYLEVSGDLSHSLCITILLISVNKMLMKFQGQWMSVDTSGSFFPKVVCTGEVKTFSRSSYHGTDRKAPACSAPSSCTAPVSQPCLSSPHSSTASSLHTQLCSGAL